MSRLLYMIKKTSVRMSKITEKAHFPHGPIVKSRNFYSSEKKGILFYVLSVILYLLHNYTGIV